MSDGEQPTATLIAVGATPQATPLSLRERLIVGDDRLAGLLTRLGGARVGEAVALATCERTEVFALSAAPDATRAAIVGVLADLCELAAAEIEPLLHCLSGEAAIRHLFSLAASLESLVVGEPNVLGQLKAGWRLAKAAGMVGKEFELYLQAAFAAAKRVRSCTGIGTGPTSLAAAAVGVAASVHGRLAARRALLIGGAEMAVLLAQALLAAGLRDMVVTDPIAERAERAADTVDGHMVPFDVLADALVAADIVISALGRRRVLLTPALMERVLRQRRQRPVVLFDCAVPGDVDPAIDAIEGAFRYDLDDLERLARDGHLSRHQDLAQARALIDAEVAAFLVAQRERDAVPALLALRRHFEAMRTSALADAGGDAEKATRLLMNRLLHAPSEVLKTVARGNSGADLSRLERALSRLFRLEIGETENEE